MDGRLQSCRRWRAECPLLRIAETMTATDPKLIESLDMSTPRHGVARLLHASEHPMYYDFNADLELDIALDDLTDKVTGRTLYEKMMFR